MKYLNVILFSVCTLFVSLTYAQSDNCRPFNQGNGNLNVPIDVSGNRAVAVLNTGVLPIGISSALAKDIGLEVEAVPDRNLLWSAIPSIIGQVSDVPIEIFDQNIEMEQMYVLENEERFVYLSLLMFSDLVMQINFPESQLCFLSRGALDLREVSNINMRSSRGGPAVQVTLNNDEKIWLELQFEFQGAVRLDKSSAEDLGLASEESELAGDSASPPEFMSATVDSLSLGPNELGNIEVSYPDKEPEVNSD
jgi:hypothetical protein